jgi:hypothetical protein
MGKIKAIETRYKGYRFRSRTEARWAVFFDAMGLPWRYEVEGFWTSLGGYLPDFDLGGTRLGMVHVEIKAEDPTGRERRKLWDVVAGTGRAGILLEGDPGRGEVVEISTGGTVVVWKSLRSARLFPHHRDDAVERACEEARGARFEHGEKPSGRRLPRLLKRGIRAEETQMSFAF